MKTNAFDALEFDKLRQILAGYTQSPMGEQLALALLPQTELAPIELAHSQVAECISYQRDFGRMRISEIKDPTPILQRLPIANTHLSAEELLQLQSIINIGHSLRQQFREAKDKFKILGAVIERLPNLTALYNRLRATLLPSGEINEDASPDLKRLRREINILRAKMYRQLEALIDQAGSEGAVRDDFVTMRNGRFVIPVRNDFRGRVPGVVHGHSSSGATAFVEPISVIEENNEMVRLKEMEEAEVIKILFSLSMEMRKEYPSIAQLVETLAQLDLIIAKAELAQDYSCIVPKMNKANDLDLIDARHPLLEHGLRGTAHQVVPISLTLNPQQSAMVISGPNAGGKTVVLKTVGLLALMAQAGMLVPAKSAHIPIFDQILADIGDHQSIAANLSTFSSHIKNISNMAAMVADASLVLLDEVGTGTDPEEGAALGVAIVDYFKQHGAIVLVSTHYNPLKFYATETPGVVSACVEFNEITLQPTYRLLLNIAGTSSGIEIARRLGLAEAILATAQTKLSEKDLDQTNFLKKIKFESDHWRDLNIALESERQATAEKYQNIDKEFAAQERIWQQEFQQQIKTVIQTFEAESQQLLAELSDKSLIEKLSREREKRVFKLKQQAQQTTLPTAAAKNSLMAKRSGKPTVTPAKPELPMITTFRVGDRVETELGQQGTVEEIKGDDIFVRIGVMRFKTLAGNLKLLDKVKQKGKLALPKGVNLVRDSAEITSELNIIGYHVEEACEQVDKFLDQAFLDNYDRVRIVHGHGLGKLRQAVANMLRTHPHVAKFSIAESAEGGSGATIVELRQ